MGPRGPNFGMTSPTQGTATRRSARQTLSQNEIEKLSSVVTDPISAEQYLSSNLLCHLDEPFTLTHLISTLFHITQLPKTPLPVITAIRATAFILKKHAADEIAETVARQLSDTLTPKIVDHVIAAIAPQVAKVLDTSTTLENSLKRVDATNQSLTSTLEKTDGTYRLLERIRNEKEESSQTAIERVEDAADALYVSVEDCQNAMKVLSLSLEATQDKINHLYTQLSSSPSQPIPHTLSQSSYSSIAAAHLPPSVDKAIGRAAIRARQVLLDPQPGELLFPPNTSNFNIAKRLKDALEKARDESTPLGSIRAVMALRNGGIVVEMETESLAMWLNSPSGRAALEGSLDSPVSFRNRTYPIVIEYLPIQLQIEKDDFLRGVEQDNNLSEGALSSIRWIKPPLKRSAEQRKAFALVQVANIQTANDILRDELCIANERVGVHKDRKEPLRCAKCQRFNHIARNCQATEDTCGTCGGSHRTAACNSFHTTRCVNCHSLKHTSWSRSCPEFTKRCREIDEKHPENRMPYFPTDHAWTQVIRPAKPAKSSTPPASPPRRSQDPHSGTLRQTTINFHAQAAAQERSPQRPQDPSLHDLIVSSPSWGEGTPHDSTPTPSSSHV